MAKRGSALDSRPLGAENRRVNSLLTLPAQSSPGQQQLGWTALTATAPIIWATTYIVTTELLPPGHPFFASVMRALPAGLIALTIGRRLPHGSWWWKSTTLGLLNIGAFFPLLFIAAQHLPGGVAATLGSVQPVIAALLAVIILKERLSHWRVAWGVCGVIGVSLVVLGPEAGFDSLGIIAGIGGAVFMAAGVVLTKKWGRPEGVSGIALAGWQLTSGGLFLAILTLLFDGVPAHIDTPAIIGYLWLGIFGGLISYTLWFAGIRRLQVTATALLALLIPLVAALIGATLAGETFSLAQSIGFILALTAMLAGQLNPSKRRNRHERAVRSVAE